MGVLGRRASRTKPPDPETPPSENDQPTAALVPVDTTPAEPPGLRSTGALTAAVSRVQLDGAAWRTYRFGDRAWQADAWRLYDITGSLRFIANWIGSSIANCRLYVAGVSPDGDAGAEVNDNDEIAGLAAGPLGAGSAKSEALRLLGIDLFVPGEAYIVAEAGGPDGEDLWWVITGRQIKRTGDRIEIKRAAQLGGGTLLYRDGVDLLIRCWTPHPADTAEPDSPTRSAIPDLRELEALRKREFAELDSRLAGAGMLLLPDGLDLPRGADDPPGTSGFQAMLQRAMATSLRDRSSAEAMVPIMISGQADLLDKVRHLSLWSDMSDQILPLRQEAIQGLARALDIPPEILLGVGNTNHWNAWAVSDEAINTQIKPVLNRIASALTLGYLGPALEELGYEPAEYTYAFDWSDLAVRPNRAADATTAHDRMLLSDDAARSAGAWGEEDKPADTERLRRLAEKVLLAAPQIALTDPGIRELVGLPPDTALNGPNDQQPPQDTGPSNELPPAPQPEENGPPRQQPNNGDQQPTADDGKTPAALTVAARFAVRRALELAGGRLVPHRHRDRHPDTPRHQLHTSYGPVPADRVPELLAGAFSGLDTDLVGDLNVDPAAFGELLTEFATELLTRGMAYEDTLLRDLLAAPTVRARLRRIAVPA